LDVEHVSTLQHHYIIGKKPSLVLNGRDGHHGDMNTTVKTQKNHRIRTALRNAWRDQVAANRALLRINPSDERVAH
jgi:hypothetical protein